MRLKRGFLAVMGLIIIYSTHALEMNSREVVKGMGDIFKIWHDLFQSQYVVYGVTLIFGFILFYSIYNAALGRVALFRGEGAVGSNKSAKLLAIALSALTTTSIFALRKNVSNVINSFLKPFGDIGGIVLAIIMYMIVSRSNRDAQFLGLGNHMLGLISAGLVMIFYSKLTDSPQIAGWGMIFIIVSLLVGIGRSARRRHASYTPRERSRVRHVEREGEREARRERRFTADEYNQIQEYVRNNMRIRDIVTALDRASDAERAQLRAALGP